MSTTRAAPTVDLRPEGPPLLVDEAALDLAIEHLLDLAESVWRECQAAERIAHSEAA